jgi:XTP/dITP diphosphohydrolase
VSLPPRWVLATANRGKVAELQALFAESGLGLTLLAQSDLGVSSPDETGTTFIENALLKARHATRATGLPAIADDSGLAVAALGGAPGVKSARFAGPDADDQSNVAKLLAALAGLPRGERGARFHCVLVALLHADDPAPVIATGEWSGEHCRTAGRSRVWLRSGVLRPGLGQDGCRAFGRGEKPRQPPGSGAAPTHRTLAKTLTCRCGDAVARAFLCTPLMGFRRNKPVAAVSSKWNSRNGLNPLINKRT